MAFSSGNSGGPMAEINVPPLADVMLVLLSIFIITAPLMSYTVEIDLPQAVLVQHPQDRKTPTTPPITISVKENGDLFWGDEPVSKEILESRLSSAAELQPQPKLNLRGDKTTKMGTIVEVTKIAQSQGMLDIGYVATKEKGQ